MAGLNNLDGGPNDEVPRKKPNWEAFIVFLVCLIVAYWLLK